MVTGGSGANGLTGKIFELVIGGRLWEVVAHGDSTVISFYISAPVFIVRLRGSV